MEGQFYSMVALVIFIPITLFVILMLSSSTDVTVSTTESIAIDQQHQITKNIEADMQRALEIIGKRALVSANNHIITTGFYLPNASSTLAELAINGTLNGNSSVIMFSNTLGDWMSRMNSLQTGFSVSIAYDNFSVQEISGPEIAFSLDLHVNTTDRLNRSRIRRTVRKIAFVSSRGFEDPLFTVTSSGQHTRTVLLFQFPYAARLLGSGSSRAGNCTGNVSFSAGSPDTSKILVASNVTGLTGFAGYISEASGLPNGACYVVGLSNAVSLVNSTIQESGYPTLTLDEPTGAWSIPLASSLSYYHNFSSNTGPSFLRRMEGSTAGNGGMETFVIPGLGISKKPNVSRVDYLYFAGSNNSTGKVRGFPTWFRIDWAHAVRYNISSLWEAT